MTDRLTAPGRLGAAAWISGLVGLAAIQTGAAHACPCEPISPLQGFERAQYVFTGKVAEATRHTWIVDVDRIWKGADKLAGRARLLDVYAGIDCGFYFEAKKSYLFFVIVAKSSRYVYYQPQVCNWTSPLQSRRVESADGPMWLEDFIVKSFGPGEPPTAEDPWDRSRVSHLGAP